MRKSLRKIPQFLCWTFFFKHRIVRLSAQSEKYARIVRARNSLNEILAQGKASVEREFVELLSSKRILSNELSQVSLQLLCISYFAWTSTWKSAAFASAEPAVLHLQLCNAVDRIGWSIIILGTCLETMRGNWESIGLRCVDSVLSSPV